MIEIVALVGAIVVMGGFAVFVGLAPEREPQRAQAADVPSDTVPSRFFGRGGEPEVIVEREPIAADAALRRLERHVRAEQVAVEGFLRLPSAENLRRRSASPLVN
ncbi:MAG: hypothetical protein HY907_10555 [Deltaproteobacteria bacterium]|nr:hypothetical protein [Deltaproteobacteria bacterium]